jgi:uncharacterized protein (DUF362 family)
MKKKSTVSIVQGKVIETQQQYGSHDLKVVKDMLMQSFDNLGGLENMIKHSDKVLIKPNLVEVPYAKTAGSVLTDPRILEALCGILRDYGVAQILVGEGKSVNLRHISAGARKAFEGSGLADAVRRGGGEIIAWDEEPFIPVKHPNLMLWDAVDVPKSILDCDYFINVPKMKTHGQTEITCGIKSMQGVYCTDDKILFHDESFPWKMADMLKVAMPDLNIVDGLIAGEGFGPIYTEPVDMGLIIASTDVVATDAVCSKLMGIDPIEVPITRLCAREGLGCDNLDEINIIGEPIEKVMKYFKRSGIWNPIGMSDRIKIFAGGASRFELAQVAATIRRMEWDGTLDKLTEDICVFIGDNPPVPKKEFKNVFIIGDAAIRDCKIEGVKISGNPPLPSVQIVQAFEKTIKTGNK